MLLFFLINKYSDNIQLGCKSRANNYCEEDKIIWVVLDLLNPLKENKEIRGSTSMISNLKNKNENKK